jgi:hypothetical protein
MHSIDFAAASASLAAWNAGEVFEAVLYALYPSQSAMVESASIKTPAALELFVAAYENFATTPFLVQNDSVVGPLFNAVL